MAEETLRRYLKRERAQARAFCSISRVMSTPITRPEGPTSRSARKQSLRFQYVAGCSSKHCSPPSPVRFALGSRALRAYLLGP